MLKEKKYTAEQYVDQFLISVYNDLIAESQTRYDRKLENELFILNNLIDYIRCNEFLLESRTLDEWSEFLDEWSEFLAS